MEYEEIKPLKLSEKSNVYLVREKGGEQMFVRKVLAGQHSAYQALQGYRHPGLPEVYEVTVSGDHVTVTEQYIEGQSCAAEDPSEKQFRQMVRELCSVLEFLHGKGIIHRDIKPSNILLTKEGHVCLIDFDASRIPKEEKEQDTRLLGTRGFAPPEQYGFAQTDARADIYALGITLKQLAEGKRWGSHYERILRRCTNLDPDKRYQSVRQLRQAFALADRKLLWGAAVLVLLALAGFCTLGLPALRGEGQSGNPAGGEAELKVLPAPGNPHWDGEKGLAVWDNVPDSGEGDESQFRIRLYKRDTAAAPDPDDGDWYTELKVRFGGSTKTWEMMNWSVSHKLEGNGFYFFSVSAVGDNVRFADSPYVMSDAFEYTGESAPPLPAPEGLAWKLYENENKRFYIATWSNLDDYEDSDYFDVTFYDQTDTYVMNNTWQKSNILEKGYGGIPIPTQFLTSGPGSAYRFTVQVYSSRPNEYRSLLVPDPVPEEYYGPWLPYGPKE